MKKLILIMILFYTIPNVYDFSKNPKGYVVPLGFQFQYKHSESQPETSRKVSGLPGSTNEASRMVSQLGESSTEGSGKVSQGGESTNEDSGRVSPAADSLK